jgi:tetratricopeptide (TPR) repeat protein
VRIGGFAEAHRQLTALIGRYPAWPHPRFYRAELLMWVGLLDDARADLEAALGLDVADPEIERGHWPAIGLAGIHVLQGRPHEALKMLERAARRFDGPPAQPYHAWRGETLRALGHLDEARVELERVCPPRGLRLGSCITLGLLYRDLGYRQRPADVLAQLIEQGPALMIEVTRASSNERLRSALEPHGLDRLSDDDRRELLERAQAAMRGNRSASCVTFVDVFDRLRVIPPGGIYQCVDRPDEIAALRAEIRADGSRRPAGPGPRPNRRA